MASTSERENREIETANASGNTPVVFIHGPVRGRSTARRPSAEEAQRGPRQPTCDRCSVSSFARDRSSAGVNATMRVPRPWPSQRLV